MENQMCQLWDPTEIFRSLDENHAIVVLNRPILCEESVIKNIWKTAKVTVTVDGGTDRWLTFLGKDGEKVLNGSCQEYLPTLITGDMDSVSAGTLKKLESHGSKVLRTMDQNKTDYTKSLQELGFYCRESEIKLKAAYVLAETSGRFDQIIAGISTLYKSLHILDKTPVIQISKNSLIWLLQPGMHKIIIPEALKNCNSWCGLLPIGFPAKNVSTTGLKWNLEKQCLAMDGLVSSSNTYADEPYVTVSTDSPIVWTMGIEPIIKNIRR
ncbi:thiamin pyrophosphokinase 1 isoform X2 [Belonocnema kinseyi]|nr:thiamin pyrophosphokinase 1 isoform X2 [Belonocnema kinseyi]XP_033214869.1 thiamin pyrophosphokinase 1 isoform X2 [Belonocnema kinseyi]